MPSPCNLSIEVGNLAEKDLADKKTEYLKIKQFVQVHKLEKRIQDSNAEMQALCTTLSTPPCVSVHRQPGTVHPCVSVHGQPGTIHPCVSVYGQPGTIHPPVSVYGQPGTVHPCAIVHRQPEDSSQTLL